MALTPDRKALYEEAVSTFGSAFPVQTIEGGSIGEATEVFPDMFERFTERARRVLFFARFEASQLGSISIESEHLLLGLIREGKGLTSRILARAHIDLGQIRKDIEDRTVFHEKVPTSVEIPFSAETRRILQFAADEADRLSHNYIGTEHMLLGILREERSVAASILMEKGMRLQTVRDDIAQLLSEKTTFAPLETERPPADSFDAFRSLPRYLPSNTVHISFSRQQDAAWSESPRHWIGTGLELEPAIARAYGVNEVRVEIPVDSHHRYIFKARYDIAIMLREDAGAGAIARILQQAIEDQFQIAVTREAGADGEMLVVRAK
jgi:Clp amino terminal domain, pathogenicity island component